MGHRHRSTSRATWLSLDNYLVGALGLVIAAALGTVAATVALSGHYLAAVAMTALALAFALPAAYQAVGELFAIALLIGTLLVFALLTPALAVSPALRKRARKYWSNARR
ncbi:MMPL family transporter [Nocardia arizonensis]|uniref:MMPL family transporter n=1 Tax=Nocardia arizonensis TaxID=1141647 RepID=UPI000AC0F892|nr:MMPL family transporter [Nocardia arizonensis]